MPPDNGKGGNVMHTGDSGPKVTVGDGFTVIWDVAEFIHPFAFV